MATTPAPTLEELPPQKGSILELHSINSDFGGKLVQYERADKEQPGKYYVSIFEDETKVLRVKAKCCRRPDIKPLELRVLLMQLSWQISENIRKSEGSETWEQDADRVRGLIAKDPCCAPAHEALGWILFYKNDFQEGILVPAERNEEAVIHFYRCLGSLYAYRDWLNDPEDFSMHLEITMSALLAKSGHHRSAVRMSKSSHNRLGQENARAMLGNQFRWGNSLFHLAERMADHDQYSKKCGMLLEASAHFLNVLTWGAHHQEQIKGPSEKGWVRSSIERMSGVCIELGSKQAALSEDEMSMLLQRRHRLATSLLKACTDEKGAIVFLTEEEALIWQSEADRLRLGPESVESLGANSSTED